MSDTDTFLNNKGINSLLYDYARESQQCYEDIGRDGNDSDDALVGGAIKSHPFNFITAMKRKLALNSGGGQRTFDNNREENRMNYIKPLTTPDVKISPKTTMDFERAMKDTVTIRGADDAQEKKFTQRKLDFETECTILHNAQRRSKDQQQQQQLLTRGSKENRRKSAQDKIHPSVKHARRDLAPEATTTPLRKCSSSECSTTRQGKCATMGGVDDRRNKQHRSTSGKVKDAASGNARASATRTTTTSNPKRQQQYKTSAAAETFGKLKGNNGTLPKESSLEEAAVIDDNNRASSGDLTTVTTVSNECAASRDKSSTSQSNNVISVARQPEDAPSESHESVATSSNEQSDVVYLKNDALLDPRRISFRDDYSQQEEFSNLTTPDINLMFKSKRRRQMLHDGTSDEQDNNNAGEAIEGGINLLQPSALHMQFQAELHLLDSFNESLRQVMDVENCLQVNRGGNETTNLLTHKQIHENFLRQINRENSIDSNSKQRDNKTSGGDGDFVVAGAASNEQHVSTNRTSTQVAEVQTQTVNDMATQTDPNSSLLLKTRNFLDCASFVNNNSSDGPMELQQMDDASPRSNMRAMSEISLHETTSSIKTETGTEISISTRGLTCSFNKFLDLEMAELIRDEKERYDKIEMLFKTREKSLNDRTRKLVQLEEQKRALRDTGKESEVSSVKKKQRALLLKLQQEKEEMNRLKELHKIASQERKLMLQKQRNMFNPQMSTKNILTKLKKSQADSQSPRRLSGPMKGYDIRSNSSMSSLVDSDKSQLDLKLAISDTSLEDQHSRRVLATTEVNEEANVSSGDSRLNASSEDYHRVCKSLRYEDKMPRVKLSSTQSQRLCQIPKSLAIDAGENGAASPTTSGGKAKSKSDAPPIETESETLVEELSKRSKSTMQVGRSSSKEDGSMVNYTDDAETIRTDLNSCEESQSTRVQTTSSKRRAGGGGAKLLKESSESRASRVMMEQQQQSSDEHFAESECLDDSQNSIGALVEHSRAVKDKNCKLLEEIEHESREKLQSNNDQDSPAAAVNTRSQISAFTISHHSSGDSEKSFSRSVVIRSSNDGGNFKSSKKLEQILNARETALASRKSCVEEWMAWHSRLRNEEHRVARMEEAALKIVNATSSALACHDATMSSDTSDVEGRIEQLTEKLAERTLEMARLRKERRRQAKQRLRALEANLLNQIRKYDTTIQEMRRKVETKKGGGSSSSSSKLAIEGRTLADFKVPEMPLKRIQEIYRDTEMRSRSDVGDLSLMTTAADNCCQRAAGEPSDAGEKGDKSISVCAAAISGESRPTTVTAAEQQLDSPPRIVKAAKVAATDDNTLAAAPINGTSITKKLECLQQNNKSLTEEISTLENELKMLSEMMSRFEKKATTADSQQQQQQQRSAERSKTSEDVSDSQLLSKSCPDNSGVPVCERLSANIVQISEITTDYEARSKKILGEIERSIISKTSDNATIVTDEASKSASATLIKTDDSSVVATVDCTPQAASGTTAEAELEEQSLPKSAVTAESTSSKQQPSSESEIEEEEEEEEEEEDSFSVPPKGESTNISILVESPAAAVEDEIFSVTFSVSDRENGENERGAQSEVDDDQQNSQNSQNSDLESWEDQRLPELAIDTENSDKSRRQDAIASPSECEQLDNLIEEVVGTTTAAAEAQLASPASKDDDCLEIVKPLIDQLVERAVVAAASLDRVAPSTVTNRTFDIVKDPEYEDISEESLEVSGILDVTQQASKATTSEKHDAQRVLKILDDIANGSPEVAEANGQSNDLDNDAESAAVELPRESSERPEKHQVNDDESPLTSTSESNSDTPKGVSDIEMDSPRDTDDGKPLSDQESGSKKEEFFRPTPIISTSEDIELMIDKLKASLEQPGLEVAELEAKLLRIEQLQIELEIKKLEAEEVSYYVREIPNKPPPPYTPPESSTSLRKSELSKSPLPAVVPSNAEELTAFTEKATIFIFEARQEGAEITGLQPPSEICELCMDNNEVSRKDRKIYNAFLFDLCKEVIADVYRSQYERPGPSWTKPSVKTKPAVKIPKTIDELNEHTSKEVATLFGFKTKLQRENMVMRWSRKRRDRVDELLAREAQAEEDEWTKFHYDELSVKNELTIAILDSLIADTTSVVRATYHKRTKLG